MISGVQAHKRLPDGEVLGATFEYQGTTYIVTQNELDRLANLPSAEEIKGMVDWWKGLDK